MLFRSDGVTSIGYEAFCWSSLTGVAIPSSVTRIEGGVFNNCPELSIVYFGTESQWNEISKDPEWSLGLNDYTVYYIGDLKANANTLDFSTFAPNDETFAGTDYTDRTSPDGWTATGARIKLDESDADALKGSSVIVLNGNTAAVGTLTSPILEGGVVSISFKFAYFWSEPGNIQFDLIITDENGQQIEKKEVEIVGPTAKNAYNYDCFFETPIQGNFIIKIVNKCPSNKSANKDRVAIWDFTWVSVEGDSSEAPDEATAD